MRRAVIALITGSIPFPDQGDVSRHVDEDVKICSPTKLTKKRKEM